MKLQKQIVDFLATGFYSGKIPFAPGTWGTVVAIPVAYFFAWICGLISGGGESPFYLVLCVIGVALASLIAELHERYTDAHDPKEITIDEVIGYMITVAWLPLTWQAYLAAFVVFRFFDILKPFPISYMDKNIKGGLGTVLDDVAAGLVANFILQLVYMKTDWLGAHLNGSF